MFKVRPSRTKEDCWTSCSSWPSRVKHWEQKGLRFSGKGRNGKQQQVWKQSQGRGKRTLTMSNWSKHQQEFEIFLYSLLKFVFKKLYDSLFYEEQLLLNILKTQILHTFFFFPWHSVILAGLELPEECHCLPSTRMAYAITPGFCSELIVNTVAAPALRGWSHL